MPIGLINVTNLARVRRPLRLGWRIFIILAFLLFICLWLALIAQSEDLRRLLIGGSFALWFLIVVGVLLLSLLVALFSKGDFARFVFALVSGVTTLLILLLLLIVAYVIGTMPQVGSPSLIILLVLALIGFALCWDFIIRPGYLLFLSLIPFGRPKAFRQQVVASLLVWSGRWKGREEPQVFVPGERRPLTPGAYYRLALGVVSFVIGSLFVALAMFSLVNVNFLPAIYHLEFSNAWQMLINFQITSPGSSWDTLGAEILEAMNSLLVIVLGIFCFFVFGYFWTQWQRENTSFHRVPLLQHMTSPDLLLLRSFKDDVKFVGRTTNNILMIPFTVYGWSFTFEQLIVNRLKYLGKVRLLDIEQDNTELLEKWWLRGFVKLLGEERLKKLFSAIFPASWHRLPAKGGIRYYIDTQGDEKKWQEEIEKAMSIARMIIVLLGTTKSLNWEIGRIEELHFSEKTVFVMPPLVFKKNYQARWQQFTEHVCQTLGYDKELLRKVDPKRVLAACIRNHTLVLITGKGNSRSLLYEAAVDVATILVVADSAQSNKMIQKYLT
ncbi:MAG: hypothetical protein LC803_09730 [Acidobacteria bacterium]|nr:hypothetical protein [Acidobacteriota bacterium]